MSVHYGYESNCLEYVYNKNEGGAKWRAVSVSFFIIISKELNSST